MQTAAVPVMTDGVAVYRPTEEIGTLAVDGRKALGCLADLDRFTVRPRGKVDG